MAFEPYVISWNLTKNCNLKCSHCYLDADYLSGKGKETLSTDEALSIVDQLAEVNPHAILILTGGEPLLRHDIHAIASHAHKRGFMVVLGTNGLLLSDSCCKRLKESGVSGIGISLDSLTPALHDSFRGMEGAWEKTVNNIENILKHDMDFQIQMTVTKENRHELQKMAHFAWEKKARVFNIFFLVCTGRGEDVTNLTAEEYEEVLEEIARIHDQFEGMMIRPKCAPHFKRIVYEDNPDSPLLKGYVGGCRAGTNYCRIDAEGNVTPCPYMENEAGNLLNRNFKEVWENSPVFEQMRKPVYDGKCERCEYSILCGGCRARALAVNNNMMGEDPWCSYLPGLNERKTIINIPSSVQFGLDALSTKDEGKTTGEPLHISWHPEAEKMLERIPFFAREIAKKGMEEFARKEGIEEITPRNMEDVRKKMTGSFGSKFRLFR